MILFHREEIKITPLTLLVLLGIALRIPSLFEPYWYGDEAIYLTLGEGIRQGLLLYRDIFDHKPPLIYLLAAIAGSVFWFKFILLVWNTVAIILFWKLAKNFLAALLFVLVTSLPLLEGNIANAELFILGPTLGAYLLLSNQEKITPKRVFLAGILLSLLLNIILSKKPWKS